MDFRDLLLPDDKNPKNEKLSKEERVALYILQIHKLRGSIAEKTKQLRLLQPPIVENQYDISWAKAEEIGVFQEQQQNINDLIDQDTVRIQEIEREIIDLLPIYHNMINVRVEEDVFKVGLFRNEAPDGEVKERLVIEYPK